MSEMELQADKQRGQEYCATLAQIRRTLKAADFVEWKKLLKSITGRGICRAPTCRGGEFGASNVTSAAEVVQANWSVRGAGFFLLTAVTSVGYGTYVPTTNRGKVFASVFLLVGLPLFGVANGLLAVRLKMVFARAAHRMAPRRAPPLELLLLSTALLLWLLIMAAVYADREDWSLFDGFWFAFTTSTTIGLGDFAPGESTRDWEGNYPFVFMGLALFSALLMSTAQSASSKLDNDAFTEHADGAGSGAQCEAPCYSKLKELHAGSKVAVAWMVVVVYMVFGGAIFQQLESDGAKLNRHVFDTSLRVMERAGVAAIKTVMARNRTKPPKGAVDRALELLNAQGTCPPPGSRDNVDNWGLLPSSKYAFSLFTTIGWGDLAPSTDSGKVASMIYAFVGFAVFGHALALSVAIVQTHTTGMLSARGDGVPCCERWCACAARVRFLLAVVCTSLMWWMVSSLLFTAVEEWNFGEACWFNYIAASTIGFGDFSPSFRGGWAFFELVLLCVSLVLFSLLVAAQRAIFVQDTATELKQQQQRHADGIATAHGEKRKYVV